MPYRPARSWTLIAAAWVAVTGLALPVIRDAHALRTEPKETDVLLSGADLFGPFRSVGRLDVTKTSGGKTEKWHGTAFLVSPCHVLTAAHVMYGKSDEPDIFRRLPDGKKLPKAGEPKRIWDEIQSELDSGASSRSYRFHLVRDRAGRFEPENAFRLERMVWIDLYKDWAILRLGACPGVDQLYGSIRLPDPDKVSNDVDRLRVEKAPLIVACYNDDQKTDALQVNSSSEYEGIGGEIKHRASHYGGCSGGPALAIFTKAGESDRPLDRRSLGIALESRKIVGLSRVELLGLVKLGNERHRANFATILHDPALRGVIKDDMVSNRELIERRMQTARDAAKRGLSRP